MRDESENKALGAVCTAAGMTDLSWYYGLPWPKQRAADRHANLWAVGAFGKYLEDLDFGQLARVVHETRKFCGV